MRKTTPLKVLIHAAAASVALAFASCAATIENIDPETNDVISPNGPESASLIQADFRRVAKKMVDSLANDKRNVLGRYGQFNCKMKQGRVTNNTGIRDFNPQMFLQAVESELLSRNLADFSTDADYIVNGTIEKKQSKFPGDKIQFEYYFQLHIIEYRKDPMGRLLQDRSGNPIIDTFWKSNPHEKGFGVIKRGDRVEMYKTL